MNQHDNASDEAALDVAYESLGQLALLLSASDNEEMAALLHGVCDMRELRRIRLRKGGGAPAMAKTSDTADYVIDQLETMAAELEARGLTATAILFRVAGEWRQERKSMAARGKIVPLQLTA